MIKLLLVDDERTFVEAMARRLRYRGFDVASVFSGPQALDYLEKEQAVDVVVLDVRMPGPEGLQVVSIIKRNHPLVETIMLTGHGSVDSAVEAVKLGAFDYLTKPCDLDELIAKVEKAVARKRERENAILTIRMKPYITKRDRDEMVARILEG
jgi:DNA-binding NtrC family response regulator